MNRTNAIEGYKLILQSQLKDSERDEMKFAPEIVNSENLTEVQLIAACRDRARLFRFDTTSTIQEMKAEKPHTQFTRDKKDRTETRRQNREQQQGHTVPDAQEVLLKYFNYPEVQATERELIEMASDKTRVPEV